MADPQEHLDTVRKRAAAGYYDAVVIGSGFGGAVAVTKLATNKQKVLVLERGTWWGNPEGPGIKKKSTYNTHSVKKQWWSRPNGSLGLVYFLESIYKETRLKLKKLQSGDLGIYKNPDGLYRLTRFNHSGGKVDVVSGSGVGGSSLFYSGVNLIPHKEVLERIGLGHLSSQDFRATGEWMNEYRGRITKVNTRVPVPNRISDKPVSANLDLWKIPGTAGSGPTLPASWEDHYEMPSPELEGWELDYLLLDRARVLDRALQRVKKNGGISVGDNQSSNKADIGRLRPLPLSIVEYEKWQGGVSDKKNSFCLRESRCLNGCLPSARHTLYKTIQKLGEKDVDVLTQSKVSHISRAAGGGYRIKLRTFVAKKDGQELTINAKKIFLSAGCLGTNEIMLRSQWQHAKTGGKQGLPLSDRLGERFSTNGDFFGFAKVPEYGKGLEESERMGKVNPTVGPINSSGVHIVFPLGKGGDDPGNRIDIHVEDAGIPTMFARLVETVLEAKGNWSLLVKLGKALIRALEDRNPFPIKEDPDPTQKYQAAYQTERELIQDVFFFNVMGAGPDEPPGTFVLNSKGKAMTLKYLDGRLHEWPVFAHIEKTLKTISGKNGMGARGFIPSPFWRRQKRVTVVHPLGGCVIGEDRTKGVVNKDGQVFDGSATDPTSVLPGLYITDASVIPGALAVNPTYTIVTQALRTLDKAK